ncbi:DUF5304 family protein [Streptomyces sp. DSM 44915]|uniref:DUF5304 family protein n=1 Tax=Streptomyces chisholmiae TaxID=3075540 RepID=A0ABU2JJJ9_9ACTN|nr:DUF5304 family protein [Streptomyces sp. DSM 44915]MDT0264936.1 DUF5304 family protein [Streptomyces sp. DSM 44915]
MGDAAEHPADRPADRAAPGPAAEADPWAAACAEDLAAEEARRQDRYGSARPDPAEELRRIADELTSRLGELGSRLPQVGMLAKPLANQARAAIDPVIERNADAFGHLASAGQELLAAYRSAVLGQEGRWARPADAEPGREGPGRAAPEPAKGPRADAAQGPDDGQPGNRDEPGESAGPAGGQRIDLD